MKKNGVKVLLFVCSVVLLFTMLMPSVGALSAVEDVISQLEAIDTLAQMQNKRNTYTAGNSHYDINTTSSKIITAHEKAREGYEAYLSDMFEKRQEAKNAYDELSDEQKAQIDPALTAKLNDKLENVFLTGEYPVTPRNDEYAFEAVKVGLGFAYEVGNYMISGSIPQTFILVDTSDGATTWSASEGEYAYGESNYIVTYCCDKETGLEYGTDYKRTNLEESGYFNEAEAKHIRAVVENSYPFISMDEMKQRLVDGGMDKQFVDSLNRADLISAVQMAIWSHANINDAAADGLEYFASIDIPKNRNIYFNPLHDYTNEMWEWLPKKRQRSFDARAQYRVNTLAQHLYDMKPVTARKDQIVITKAEIVGTRLNSLKDDVYDLSLSVRLNGGGNQKDELELRAVSYTKNEDGTMNITQCVTKNAVCEKDLYTVDISAKDGDEILLEVSGNQYLSKGAYFYDPEGGRDKSQSLVGLGEGYTPVHATREMSFNAPEYKITTEESIKVYQGEKTNLGIIIEPADGVIIPQFSSSDESVVKVDLNGNIKALKPGQAQITVSFNNGEVRIIPVVVAEIPEPPKKHHICFGKTDGIGWYEVSVNGGDFFPQGPNSTLEVMEGSILVVRVQDMWIDDEFDFYVNGKKVPMDPANTITVVVDGYMLIGALSMDVEVPDVKKSLNIFEWIEKAFEDFVAWLRSLFRF